MSFSAVTEDTEEPFVTENIEYQPLEAPPLHNYCIEPDKAAEHPIKLRYGRGWYESSTVIRTQ